MGIPRAGTGRLLSGHDRHDLGARRWPELGGSGPGDLPLLAVPTGSCEQHGPHLPLDTDTLVARALAAGLAERRPGVVVAPAVAIGASGEHQGFPGTLSIGTAAMTSVALEIGRSALPPPASDLPEPFCGVLFVNGHGGNVEALTEAVGVLRHEGRRAAAWHPRVPGGDPHAGRTETSLMLHLHPGAVRMDLAEEGSTARFRDIDASLRGGGLPAVSPNGILGDPRGATAEEGRGIFEALVEELAAAADRLRTA